MPLPDQWNVAERRTSYDQTAVGIGRQSVQLLYAGAGFDRNAERAFGAKPSQTPKFLEPKSGGYIETVAWNRPPSVNPYIPEFPRR
jgi:hypothetical protein